MPISDKLVGTHPPDPEGGTCLHGTSAFVVSADQSGGTHTSRTMMLSELESLLDGTPVSADAATLKSAVIDHNITSKNTMSGRQRTYRYLRELYALDTQTLAFRALRDLWDVDIQSRPLLALLCAMARDPLLRAAAVFVTTVPEGAPVSAADLAAAVQDAYPDTYNDAVAGKVGRNTASSLTQSGHLIGRTNKVRARVLPTPPVLAYALLVGHTEGRRGLMLVDTVWCKVLDRPRDALIELARTATQRGLLEFKHTGDVTEIGFRNLLRPFEEERA